MLIVGVPPTRKFAPPSSFHFVGVVLFAAIFFEWLNQIPPSTTILIRHSKNDFRYYHSRKSQYIILLLNNKYKHEYSFHREVYFLVESRQTSKNLEYKKLMYGDKFKFTKVSINHLST